MMQGKVACRVALVGKGENAVVQPSEHIWSATQSNKDEKTVLAIDEAATTQLGHNHQTCLKHISRLCASFIC